MPQEGKRSIGYRPFITCDDPRGVVECGTLRKHKNLNSLEVSKGTHKLNHVVTSWSCGGHMINNNNNNNNEFQIKKNGSRWHGISGSSGEAFVEIKKVIRNGVDKKNVNTDPSSEEASDAPSTSSSQSSIVHSSNFVSPESFLVSTASKKKSKKPKGFNLIAKLMGLEDPSVRSLHCKGDGDHKIVNQKKPAFDLDSTSPRPRMYDHDEPWKSGWKMKSLDQMIEALRFTRNPKGSQVVKPPLSSHHSESSNSKQRWDHKPPIVIIKPSRTRFSCLNLDNPIIPKPRGEVDQEMLLKMRIRTNPLAETNGFQTHKVSGSKTKGERKRTPKSQGHLQSLDGDNFTDLKPKSETKIDMLKGAITNNLKENCPDDAESVKYRDESICGRESLLSLEEPTMLAQDASQIEITDYVNDDRTSPSETPSSSSSSGNQCSTSASSGSSRASIIHIDKEENYVIPLIDHSSSRKGSTGDNKLKALLLTSSTFINRVEELFGLKGSADQEEEIGDDVDARMLLDCANELVELHGSECSTACLPIPSTHKTSCVSCYYTNLDQLMDEVCDGIEALRCYAKEDGDGHSTDNLHLLVKGDLRNGKMVTGVWDIGWRNSGSVDEIEEITKLVLDGLIDEILVDLAL